ncbi:MAG: SpvB/TcaC N-terminal domain-containing protein, partial [Pseudomonadota bacterium]
MDDAPDFGSVPFKPYGETTDERSTEQGDTGLSLPGIELPKGGGAIRPLGEAFSANPATGAGGLNIPLGLTSGRSGFGPTLNATYSTAAGNGILGFGWTLATGSIRRKTSRGLPRYTDDDIFVLAGGEDLVPVDDGSDIQGDHRVTRYRPRIEGGFARIELWTHLRTGDQHWRTLSPANVTTLFGVDADSRVSDPSDPRHVFEWLIVESFDDTGNVVTYSYVPEDDQGVDVEQHGEVNRQRTAGRYLKTLQWGNRVSHLVDPVAARNDWLFSAVLDYGEGHLHDIPKDPKRPAEEQHQYTDVSWSPRKAWEARPDPHSTFRAGFEIRTHRRCHRVLMFHHFDELGDTPCLVSATGFDFADLEAADDTSAAARAHQGSTRYGSFLRSVTSSGFVRKEGTTFLRRSVPPMMFDYARANVSKDIERLTPDALENLPQGLDGARYQWLDLNGDGLPGILSRRDGAWYYKPNLGNGTFGAVAPVTPAPSLGQSPGERPRFVDLSGDGQLDVAVMDGPVRGFYERTKSGNWTSFRPFPQMPNIDMDDPNLRFLDLTGDGLADILVAQDDTFLWYASNGEDGYSDPRRVHTSWQDEDGPRVVFNDGEASFHLADMSGDGLTDLVRIRNGDVVYWPNLGYGRFGRRMRLANAPRFDQFDRFESRRILLGDIDGSGTTDIVYLSPDGVHIYFNLAGNELSAPEVIEGLRIDRSAVVTLTDLLGKGTASLVWSSPSTSGALGPVRYVDLMAAGKPHLMVASRNNRGLETTVEYASSTQFFLADRASGRPWQTQLPFPVHVVVRSTVTDHVARTRFSSRFTYHHGHFDGIEREFGGFAQVDQIDTEDLAALTADGLLPAANIDASSHMPPVLTRRWHHVGAHLEAGPLAAYFAGRFGRDAGEYFREPGLSEAELRAQLLPDSTLPDDLTEKEAHQASRALRGAVLREEVYALDGSDQEPLPYAVVEQRQQVRRLQPMGLNESAVFQAFDVESLTFAYDRNRVHAKDGRLVDAHQPGARPRLDPRVTHALTLEHDRFGTPLKAVQIGYPRRFEDPGAPEVARIAQAETKIVLTETEVTNDIDTSVARRMPAAWQSTSYELTGYHPSDASGLFRRNDFVRQTSDARVYVIRDKDIPFEEKPPEGRVRRLLARQRTQFRRDDLNGALPFGTQGARGLVQESFALVTTDTIVNAAYGTHLDAADIGAATDLVRQAGLPGDPEGGWWAPSGRIFLAPKTATRAEDELAYATRHFFLPHRMRDAHHSALRPTESHVVYDRYDLMPEMSEDALGNRVTVGARAPDGTLQNNGHDYRVMQPSMLCDPNRNVAMVAFDALGLPTAAAVGGKPEDDDGDRLGPDIPLDLTDAEFAAIFAEPEGALAAIYLGRATTCAIVDPRPVQISDTALPRAALSLAREHHGPDPGRIVTSLSYFDGAGTAIQTKALRDEAETQRWLCSGWVVQNNKGILVRQYEPFFTETHAFAFDVRVGVSPIMLYDPPGRPVATLMPDKTFTKVKTTPWRAETWDAGDTVLISNPANDPDIGGYVARLASADYLPTWHTVRIDGDKGPEAQDAARQSEICFETPVVSHTDSLGRVIASHTLNRVAQQDGSFLETEHLSSATIDITGQPSAIRDTAGRRAMTFLYDMAGQQIAEASNEAGRRWILTDASGNPAITWDDRGRCTRTSYDQLRRPVAVWMSKDGGAETQIATSTFGEDIADAEVRNLRGQAVETRDQSGFVTAEHFDFKGNLTRSTRRVAAHFDALIDWSGDVPLDPEAFVTEAMFDALNRPILSVPPYASSLGRHHIVQPRFDHLGQMTGLDVWHDRSGLPDDRLDPASDPPSAAGVRRIGYDARGARTDVNHANGVHCQYAYDPENFRLVRLTTTRPGGLLQDMRYSHDALGHLTHIVDAADPDAFFDGAQVGADQTFEHDAIGQLIRATGRVHLGQAAGTAATTPDAPARPLPHPNDGQALARYVEHYGYDIAGNIQEMRRTVPSRPDAGWTRRYAYDEPGQLDADQPSNRLTATRVGDRDAETVGGYDAHGNMLGLPHLARMTWDHADRLRMTARTVNGEQTWYVYDGSGERIRKVTTDATGRIRHERLYLPGGIEIFRRHGPRPLARETLHVSDGAERFAEVETRLAGEEPGQDRRRLRIQIGNHQGSISLEVDEAAQVISVQEYSPYGARTYLSVAKDREAPRRAYTGQERDGETGLQRHGLRY